MLRIFFIALTSFIISSNAYAMPNPTYDVPEPSSILLLGTGIIFAKIFSDKNKK